MRLLAINQSKPKQDYLIDYLLLQYDTEKSLKESVFDHYTEFIGFSEEIQKMDDSMEQLKKNLNRTYKLLDNLKVER